MDGSSSSSYTKNSTTSATSSATTRKKKRLLFDRRYGWVIDEWKEPSAEALAGGRGMFCILPLTKSFLNSASHSINLAANFAVKIFERPDLFTPQAVKKNFDQQLENFNSALRKSEVNHLPLMVKFPSQTPTFSSHLETQTGESQMV
ncbi:uncharacterized protein LOC126666929 [Mercurialis annua]|uniref:uncharacterized protein LOC126666929 n=1 Tax=Mercurialis annua TaxID=3986 RepID=UPI00215FD5F1|nr:uncharacterized protein LOC126666929 [Mercurialis annua]XP_050215804.1 uncharacterized protein LOC126666929 [Mercurialis annua]